MIRRSQDYIKNDEDVKRYLEQQKASLPTTQNNNQTSSNNIPGVIKNKNSFSNKAAKATLPIKNDFNKYNPQLNEWEKEKKQLENELKSLQSKATNNNKNNKKIEKVKYGEKQSILPNYNKIDDKNYNEKIAKVKNRLDKVNQNINNHKIELDNEGKIKLTDYEIGELASQYKIGYIDENQWNDKLSKLSSETKQKIYEKTDYDFSQKYKSILNEAARGDYWSNDSGTDASIIKERLEEKGIYNKRVYNDIIEASNNYGYSKLDEADIKTSKIISAMESIPGGLKRGYYNTKYDKRIGELLSEGKVKEAAKYAKEHPYMDINSTYGFKSDESSRNYQKTGLAKTIEETSNLLGQIGGQYTDLRTAATTTAGAITGGAAGFFLPGLSTATGALKGAEIGSRIGASYEGGAAEAGGEFRALMEMDGVTPELAKNISLGVGGINAALEFLELGTMGDLLKGQFGKAYVKDIASNVAQEVLQEEVSMAGETIARELSDKQSDNLKTIIKAIIKDTISDEGLSRLGGTAKSTALSFAIIGLPSTIVKASTNSNNVMNMLHQDTQKLYNSGMKEQDIKEILQEYVDEKEAQVIIDDVKNGNVINNQENVEQQASNQLVAEQNDIQIIDNQINQVEKQYNNLNEQRLSLQEKYAKTSNIQEQNTIASQINELNTQINELVNQVESLNESKQKISEVLINESKAKLPNVTITNRQSTPQQIISNAYDSIKAQNMDVTPNTQAVIEAAAARGVNLEVVNNLNDANATWIQNDDGSRTIKISKEGLQNYKIEHLFVHEMFHDLSQTKEGQAIIDDTLKFMKDTMSNEEFEGIWDEAYNNYKDEYTGKTPSELNRLVEEEITAEFITRNLGDINFVRQLVNKKPNLARRIYNKVVNLLKQLGKNKATRYEMSYWENVRRNFEIAFNEQYQSSEQNTKNFLAGENANLTKLQEEKLKLAKELKEKRLKDKYIWVMTGWQLNKADGKWKYELPDAKFKKNIEIVPGETYKLGDVLDAPKLFKAYPQIKEYLFETADFSEYGKEGIRGTFVNKYNLIGINNKLSPKEMKSTLNHELQHIIQKIEGFARGGSVEFYKKGAELLLNPISDDKAYNLYKRTAGEVEARNVQKRANLPGIAKKLIMPSATQDIAQDKVITREELQNSLDRQGLSFNSAEMDENVDNYSNEEYDIFNKEKSISELIKEDGRKAKYKNRSNSKNFFSLPIEVMDEISSVVSSKAYYKISGPTLDFAQYIESSKNYYDIEADVSKDNEYYIKDVTLIPKEIEEIYDESGNEKQVRENSNNYKTNSEYVKRTGNANIKQIEDGTTGGEILEIFGKRNNSKFENSKFNRDNKNAKELDNSSFNLSKKSKTIESLKSSVNATQEERIAKLQEEYNNWDKTRDVTFDERDALRKKLNDLIRREDYKTANEKFMDMVKQGIEPSEIEKTPEYKLMTEEEKIRKQLKEYDDDIKVMTEDMTRIAEMIEKEEKSHRNPKDAIKEAKETMGTTDDYREAGYMLQDGDLLDFSGRYEGSSTYGRRAKDHREINEFGYDMNEFIRLGNIRMKPEGNGFEMAIEPTKEQYSKLYDYIEYIKEQEGPYPAENSFIDIDIDKENSSQYDTIEYKVKTPTSKIINDIKEYWKTGEFPKQSEYAPFMYSKTINLLQTYLEKRYGKEDLSGNPTEYVHLTPVDEYTEPKVDNTKEVVLPNKNKYIIKRAVKTDRSGEFKPEILESEATPVKINGETFAAVKEDNKWIIIDTKSGLSVSGLQGTRKSAVAQATESLNKLKQQGMTIQDQRNKIFESMKASGFTDKQINELRNQTIENPKVPKQNKEIPATKTEDVIKASIDDIKKQVYPKEVNGNDTTESGEEKAKQAKKDANVEKVAKILDERPVTEKDNDRKLKRLLKIKILDKGYYVDKYARQTKNRELSSKYDYMLMGDGIAQQIIGNERYDLKNQKLVGKGLYKVFEPIENSGLLKEFSEYMYHKHNTSRMTLDSEFGEDNKPVFGNGITANDSRKIVSEYEENHPEFMDWAKDVYDYNNYLLQTLVDYGVISSDDKAYYNKKYPYYVPTIRANDRVRVNFDDKGRRIAVNLPIKKAKGGNGDIIPLKEAMSLRTMQTINSALRNNFGNELMDSMQIEYDSQNIDVDNLIDQEIDNEETLTAPTKGTNATLTVYKDGQKITFDIDDEIYEALKTSSKPRIKALNKFNNFRRGLLTEWNPAFMITNPIKDVQDGVLNSKHPSTFMKNIAEAAKQIQKKGDYYKLYVANGGGYETYFNYGEGYNMLPKARNKFDPRKMIDKVSSINEAIEMTPRLAEFISSIEAGDSIETAVYNAQEVTTNFKRGGDWTKTLDANGVTFLNAGVQGGVKIIRNVQDAKVQGIRGVASLVTKAAIFGLAPILLNGLIWDDDDDYDELSDYVKNNYYILWKYGDNKFVRIPKGRVLSVLQNMFSQLIEASEGKDDIDVKEFVELLMNQVIPNDPTENNLLSPLIQAFGSENGNAWYGGDIVPSRLQSVPTKEQYDETTDSISIWLGNILNLSPVKINYVLDQYSGMLGDAILPYLTQDAEYDSNSVLAPIVDKFTVNSTIKNKYSSEFYSLRDEYEKKRNSKNATDTDIVRYKYMFNVGLQVSDLYKQKRDVQNNTKLTNKQKYAESLKIQNQINELCKKGIKNAQGIKVTGNDYSVDGYRYKKNEDGEWEKVRK